MRRRLTLMGLLAAAAIVAAAPGCQRAPELGKTAMASDVTRIRDSLLGEGGGPEGGAAAPVGTGWATLKGKFTFDGEKPVMPPYAVNKDPEVCAPGGQAPPQQLLVVDESSKGIANIVLFARSASRVHESAEPSDEAVVFDQKVCVFLTHVLGITVGTPVEIHNSDPVGHNTKIDGTGFNQMIPVSGIVPWTAQREAAVPLGVNCSVHPWMKAYMLPRKNGYFAVTAKDGTFEIPNLPAGEEVEIQIWHEHSAEAQGALVVDSDAAKELKWSKKGRIKIKLEENETRDIDIVVPPSAFRPI